MFYICSKSDITALLKIFKIFFNKHISKERPKKNIEKEKQKSRTMPWRDINKWNGYCQRLSKCMTTNKIWSVCVADFCCEIHFRLLTNCWQMFRENNCTQTYSIHIYIYFTLFMLIQYIEKTLEIHKNTIIKN